MPYFAWVEPSETTFESEHLRWDEQVFSFNLSQEEGDPASLTVVVRRPRNEGGDPIGLLGPGRKIWCWFALDCGPDLIRFRGRLVGIPTSIFEELVTLEFVARPSDLVAQKEALAETLRVLPFYDEIFIDESRRSDPEVVLEGYTAIWAYDRETHILSISDEITGEDGLVEFDGTSEGGKVLYEGLGLTLTGGPLTRVDVEAEVNWTQGAFASVHLFTGVISSNTLWAADWPKNGAGLGNGWEATGASADDLLDFTVNSETFTNTLILKSSDGDTRSTVSETMSYAGIIRTPGTATAIVTKDDISVTSSKDPEGGTYISQFSRQFASVGGFLPKQNTRVSLSAQYTGERPITERVSFTLFADVQHILTDPEDGEALTIDDLKSTDVSAPIGEGTAAEVPISDARRRSYIATERGNRSLEYLIILARAHLMKRARVVDITFAPKLSRMPEITLRKNVFLVEPRIGEALGKVIGYSVSLDGSDGRVNCQVTIGCAIGRGGSQVAVEGTPTYCEIAYCGNDYQQFTGKTVLLPIDSSVGYEPPNADPNDDGMNFLSGVDPADVVIQSPTLFSRDLAPVVAPRMPGGILTIPPNLFNLEARAKTAIDARHEYYKNLLAANPDEIRFKMRNMKGHFISEYEIQLTDLKIPTGYDLEMV